MGRGEDERRWAARKAYKTPPARDGARRRLSEGLSLTDADLLAQEQEARGRDRLEREQFAREADLPGPEGF